MCPLQLTNRLVSKDLMAVYTGSRTFSIWEPRSLPLRDLSLESGNQKLYKFASNDDIAEMGAVAPRRKSWGMYKLTHMDSLGMETARFIRMVLVSTCSTFYKRET